MNAVELRNFVRSKISPNQLGARGTIVRAAQAVGVSVRQVGKHAAHRKRKAGETYYVPKKGGVVNYAMRLG